MTRRPESLANLLAPPGPPSGLRTPTLEAARAAMGNARRPDIWARLWNSRPARLAWVVSVAVIAFGHLMIGDGGPSTPANRAVPVTAVAEMRNELAEVAALPRLAVRMPGFEIARSKPNSQSDDTDINKEPS